MFVSDSGQAAGWDCCADKEGLLQEHDSGGSEDPIPCLSEAQAHGDQVQEMVSRPGNWHHHGKHFVP